MPKRWCARTTNRRSVLPLNTIECNQGLCESIWLLTRRFMAANDLTPIELLSRFPSRRSTSRANEFRHVYERLDLTALAPYLGHTEAGLRALLPANFEIGRPHHFLGSVKVCLACAKMGYHSVLHEVQWIDHCPIHGLRLIESCPTCGRRMVHTSSKRLGETAITFPCGHRWTSAVVNHSPEIDATNIRRLVARIRRVRSRYAGEHWLGISLGRRSCAQDAGFHELKTLLADITGSHRPIQLSVHGSGPSRGRVFACTRRSIRSDWFQSSLQQLSSFADSIFRTNHPRVDLAYQAKDAISLISRIGQRGLVYAVQERVCGLDIASGQHVQLSIDDLTVKLLAAVFLFKHLHVPTTHSFDPGDEWSYLQSAIRVSARPLGILHVAAGRQTFYWLSVSQ